MKFAWLSDSHLGYTQYGLERRRIDFEQAFETAVEHILKAGIRSIVHTGDMLHSNRPGPDAMACLRRSHRRLVEARARMLVISGNHDRTEPPWPTLLEPNEWAYGITVADNQVVTLEGVTFFCLPFMPVEQVRRLVWPQADIMLCHLQVQEFIGFESLSAVALNELPVSYRAILIGDVHINRMMAHPSNPDCPVGYTGSTELNSESEPSEKVWTEVEVLPAQPVRFQQHNIPTRLVLRRVVEDVESLDKHVAEIMAHWQNHVTSTGDSREPLVFIEYPSGTAGLMERLKSAFNPDKWVLRFKPVLKLMAPTGVPLIPSQTELTVQDILRADLAMRQDLVPLAEQLINPAQDPNAALDEYIEGRLRQIDAASRTLDGGAPQVS